MPNPVHHKAATPQSRRKSVTIKDIAAKLGLSFQAVSQALNPRKNTSHVSESTRKRIVETAREMGYRGYQAARVLRSERSGLLGVLIFEHPLQIMRFRLHHVLAGIRAAGYRPFVHLADARLDSGAGEGCLALLDARVEGVLMVDPIGFPEESPVENLLEQGIPVVSLGSHQWRAIRSYQADRSKGFHDLTWHLIRGGCRSLTLLKAGGDDRYQKFFRIFSDDMVAGFEQAATEATAEYGYVETHIHEVEPMVGSEPVEGDEIHPIYGSGYLGMRELLAGNALPDALLCQADSWAHGALRACCEAGVKVPEELRVTGFNDEPVSSAGAPPLTTVAQPYADIARCAVEDVVAQIEGHEKNEPGRVVTLPGELMVRASSAGTPKPAFTVSP